MATYELEFGKLGDSRPVPPLTVQTTDPDVFSRAVVEHARPHITPVLTAMGRPELADCLFRMNRDRTMGQFLYLDLAGGKGAEFLPARITTTPERIQRKRTAGWKANGAKYVGRGTQWGNPWAVAKTRKGWAVNWAGQGQARPDWTANTDSRHAAHVMAVGLYREFIKATVGYAVRARVELAGRDLMCWCPLVDDDGAPVPCHASVLLQLANTAPEGTSL
ncbi:DUF4326 domain-containing protein [Streptomyces sp. NPDC048479]|uniref:DUF4326 domain-containing protein n=1 Tax=Streptomyces sp. NPDC048479 TaxID=3154725 RepID=UPI00341BFFB1